MKSRKSSQHDRIDVTKPKIVSTKSQSAINTNKSATNVFLKKNLNTLQQYNNLFGRQVLHIGDADTLFRKSLRKYNEFNYHKNTAWIKTKEVPISGDHKHQKLQTEQQLGSGDIQNTEVVESEFDFSQIQTPSTSKSQNPSQSLSQYTILGDDKEEEMAEEVEETMDSDSESFDNLNETIIEASSKKSQEGEGEPEGEDFKKLLDKSIEELKTAVDQLDSQALEDIKESDDTQAVVPRGATGDGTIGVDSKVLKELEDAETQARETAAIINALKERVAGLLNKDHMTEKEAKELEEMNIELMKHMEDFEEKTKLIQSLLKYADEYMKPLPSLPAPQKREPEDMLPKVIICGITENNMPKIIICDADKKKKKSKSPDGTRPSIMPPPEAISKRLSESYDMQEKLANDNVDLEGKRYQLQEELLNKDKTCENLQRKVCSLQAEMRILSKENSALNDKLAKVQGKCRPRPDVPCGGSRGVCPADVENRLQHYSQTTSALEKQVETMEAEVRRMQEELNQVQRERMEMEQARRLAAQAPPPPPQPQHVCRPNCRGPCRPGAAVEQQLRELREQYNRLQDDYKSKVTEVAGLRADNEKLKCTCEEMDSSRRAAQDKAKDFEDQMKKNDQERSKLLGSKEQLIEQEQQLSVAKQRFREAQDELEELRALIGDQASQLEDYRNKYLQAQQQVEEQRRRIDVLELENSRVSDQVTAEIQRVKTQFQEKLAELSPLPDILKATQLKLQEEQQLRMLAERNSEALSRDLQVMKDKEQALLSQMDKARSDQQVNDDEKNSLESKMKGWECKCNDMQQNCEKLKTDLARNEEMASQNQKRLDEKLHEIAQLTAQLETVREESARQVARTKDRCETVRRSMQGQIADLERQLAQARAIAKSAQKDRDEIRQKMQAQINNLNENFEEAQLRIRSLQGHVNFLKTSYTNMFGGGATDQSGGLSDGCDCANYP